MTVNRFFLSVSNLFVRKFFILILLCWCLKAKKYLIWCSFRESRRNTICTEKNQCRYLQVNLWKIGLDFDSNFQKKFKLLKRIAVYVLRYFEITFYHDNFPSHCLIQEYVHFFSLRNCSNSVQLIYIWS